MDMNTFLFRWLGIARHKLCQIFNDRASYVGAAAAFVLLAACSTNISAIGDSAGESIALGAASRRLQVVCIGEGAPLVLLESGMAGWSADWASVQASVGQYTRTCAYDRAGYGASLSALDGMPTPQADLEQLLATQSLSGPVVLVGHSLGGLLVADYARRHPQRVAGLVLVDAVHRTQDVDDHPTVHSGEYASQRQSLSRLLQWAVWLAPSGLLQLAGQSASPVAARLPDSVRERSVALAGARSTYVAVRAENTAFEGLLEQARAAPGLPHVPAEVLSSTQARDFPPGFDSQGMQSLWAWRQTQLAQELGVSPRAVAHSGHYPHVDQPQVVVDAVLRVLRQARLGVVKAAPEAAPPS